MLDIGCGEGRNAIFFARNGYDVTAFDLEKDGVETPIRVADEGEFMGEMAIFDRVQRSATLRAVGEARLLTIDKKNFLKRIHKDPSLAFRLVQTMSKRVRDLSDQVASLKANEERE